MFINQPQTQDNLILMRLIFLERNAENVSNHPSKWPQCHVQGNVSQHALDSVVDINSVIIYGAMFSYSRFT